MRKIASIFLLLLFGGYSFTFKTHYCFYHETHQRYHGDCEKHIKETEAKGGLADQNIFPAYYYCVDFLKNAQVQETKIISVKSPFNGLAVTPPVLEIPTPVFSVYHLPQPEPKCRSATIISVHTLRGPPLV